MSSESTPRQGNQQHLLIKSLTPKQGDAFDVGTITVLLGENNVGKSEALRDIARLAAKFDPADDEPSTSDEPQTKVIGDLTFMPRLTVDRLTEGLTRLPSAAADQIALQGLAPDLKTPLQRTVGSELKTILFRPVMTARSVWMTALGDLMPLRVSFWQPSSIPGIVESTSARGPTDAPESLLQDFQYATPEVHQQLDDAFARAFVGRHVTLDDSQRLTLSLRVGAEIPKRSEDPVEAVQQFASLDDIGSEGDGCRNFVSVLLCFLAAPGRVVLLDQPDAFLQPNQARQLGTWIAENAARLGCQVFLTARSTALLEGLFCGRLDTTLVALTRREDTTRMRPIPEDAGEAIARFPLFASQQGLDRLVQRSLVVVPDADEGMIYQTVAQRQLGRYDVGFLHAHGVANLTFVAKVFRKAQVPVCIVTELDLFQNEAGFTELVTAVTGSPPTRAWLATRERLASHIEGSFEGSNLASSASEVEQLLDQLKQVGKPKTPATAQTANDETAVGAKPGVNDDRAARWARLKSERLDALPPELRMWVEELIEDLKQKGIFVSARGRLQSWLAADVKSDQSTAWLNRAMRTLHAGQCPPELRALVADMVSFDAGTSFARAARRSNQT